MMIKTYAILGCITGYKINDIKPYVESIKKSGFSGKKYMLIYDIDKETDDYLQQSGWITVYNDLREHVILQRFIDVYAIIKQNFITDDVIIWTDVKDVVFQKDPTDWLYQNRFSENSSMEKNILACSESVILKDEPWATVNCGTSFPMEWELGVKNETSYCAGCIIGKTKALGDLFLEMYHWAKATANPQQLSDQAAYNVLIHLEHFKDHVQFVSQEEGLATQLGVVYMRSDTTQKKTEPTPIFKDGKFYNQKGELFCIVHQYDRDPQVKQLVQKLYE